MVNLTIDGREITVKENTTIMEAAAQNGIPIPKLCYLKGNCGLSCLCSRTGGKREADHLLQ